MIDTAMLHLITDAGEGVLVLVDGLQPSELLRSRLTRGEVQRQLQLMAGTLGALSPAAQAALPEVDWAGWRGVSVALAMPTGQALDDALWFGASALVPATLLWLRVYRESQPALFSYTA
jgi:uncharacterized protein with HEPN domain